MTEVLFRPRGSAQASPTPAGPVGGQLTSPTGVVFRDRSGAPTAAPAAESHTPIPDRAEFFSPEAQLSGVDKGVYQAVKGAVMFPLDVAKQQVQAAVQGDPSALIPGGPVAKAEAERVVGEGAGAIQSAKQGDILGALYQALSAVPGIGGMYKDAATDVIQGNPGVGAGKVLGNVMAARVMPDVVPPAAAAAGRGVEAAAKAVQSPLAKRFASDVAVPGAAGAVGTAVGGPGLGAAATYLTREWIKDNAATAATKATEAKSAAAQAAEAVSKTTDLAERAAATKRAESFKAISDAWEAAADRVKAEESAAARLEATREKYRGLSSPQELKMAMDQIAAQEIDAKARGLSPDEFKIQRDYLEALDMDMRRAAADTKAQEAASIAGAKTELKPLEAAEAAAGKQIAAAERTAARGKAQGQKIDLKQISRAVRANKAAAAERAKQETAREAASIAGAKAELKPLELSQRAQPKNPVLTLVEGKQAVEEAAAPKAAAPTTSNPVLELVEKNKPQISVPALDKASLLEDAVKIANQMILDGYDKPNTKAALLRTFKKRGIDEALADKVVNAIDAPSPEELMGYRSDALVWADAKLTPMEIFDKLSGKMGRERALRTGYEAVKSIPAAARTAEQAAEVVQFDRLLGGRKSLKNKVKPEMIKRSREIRPLEPSPDPNRPGSRTNP